MKTVNISRAAIALLMMLLTTATAWAETIDLSTVHADFTAQDGDVLTGTLGDYAKITIAHGATVTLSDATIKNIGGYPDTDDEHVWAGLNCQGDATIVLAGTNYVGTIGGNYSAIYVPVGYTLTIQGNGALTASSEECNCAGIGAGFERPCGNIVIAGGTITAIGKDDGAGIGGAYNAACGDITITTGVKKVTAINYPHFSHSIGAGREGTCGTVTIGGTVYPDGIATTPYTYPQVNYTVCFNANGGSGTMESMDFTTNVAQTLTANTFTAPMGGYTFTGWNTAANGSGTFFSDGQSVQDLTDEPDGTVTLYAMWFKDNLSTLGNYDVVIPDGTTLTGTLRSNAKVSIASGATVTLSGVTIYNDNGYAGLNCQGDATIVLADGSANSVAGRPGIYVPNGNTLTISGGNEGTGSLTALGLSGAGIGGASIGGNGPCGNIVITGGIVTATGGWGAAGIGSGYNNSCGTIAISGGTVTATGGMYGAGIGSGQRGSCGTITIRGGSVTANRGLYAPNSLGAGDKGSCGTVTIGGNVLDGFPVETFVYPAVTYSVSFDANGGEGTMAGLTDLKSNEELTLPANSFTPPAGKTFAGWNTAANGSGTAYADRQTVVNLTSTGGEVTLYAQWFDGDLSVLKADFVVPDGLTLRGTLQANVKVAIADGATVTLNGVTINGVDDDKYWWAGLTCLGDATIVVADGPTNTVHGFHASYAGIFVPEGKTLTISGGPLGTGSLYASSSNGVGIGSNSDARAGNIVITGGIVTASSTYRSSTSAGIGDNCGDITISGGTVTAMGGKQGAVGIGSNWGGTCGNITISGGTVTATGRGGQAGIGKYNSENSSCGDITLGGGIITASSYNSTVKIADGIYFIDDNGDRYNPGTLSDAQKTAIAGQTLESGNIDYDLSLFGIGNDGSPSKPYVISSDAGWKTFCDIMKDDDNYYIIADKAIKLGADIVSKQGVRNMAGTSKHPFSGTFYGNGHTLTFSATATRDGCAPFLAIDGATIRYLKVAGTINTGYQFAAGIAAHSYGNCTIRNCHSSITINSSTSGDGTHAGFVAVEENGSLTFTNCLMDGSITGSNTQNCGGFVGWRGGGTLTFNNCLMAGALGISLDENSATFNRNGESTLNNCYYKGSYTNATLQGNATSATGSDLQTLLGSGWQVIANDVVVPIMDAKNLATATISGSRYYLYTGSNIDINYTVTAADGTVLTKGTDYTETLSPSTVQAKGNYTLTVTAKDGSGYSGSQTFHFTVVDGTPVTSETTEMTTGPIYVVRDEVSIDSRITISGNVILFLYDNCTLNATKGINVSADNSITINAQSTGNNMGTLIAAANTDYCAGIGGGNYVAGGTITINGGNVTATGGYSGAGIGGGNHGAGGTITINGGKVSATGGILAAGIGGGDYGAGGTITINGGKVTANGGDYAAGIGGGDCGAGGTITINGGKVTANGGWYAAGIGGGGSGGAGGTITLSYTMAESSVYASSYNGTVSIEPNKMFTDGTNTYTSETPSETLAALTDKTLTPKLFNITVSEYRHGTVIAQEKAASSETVTLTITPAEGYALQDLTVTDGNDAPVTVTNGQFTMPASDVTVSATFTPDPAHFSDDGNDEYTIKTATGWGVFCDMLADGETFSGKTVKLGANIEVSRMAGSSGHDFCGTFDGGEYTLTVKYGTADSPLTEGLAAPFRYVSTVTTNNVEAPATIKNLHVDGDIYTQAKYAAGIVAQHWGTLTIKNCRSSIVIHSSVSGDGTHGGIEAASTGTLNITGCVFDGKLLSKNTGNDATTNCGGFVGYGTSTITNSLYAPAARDDGETEITNGSCTFVRNASPGTNCYYTRLLGTAQGTALLTVTAGDNVIIEAISPVGEPTSTDGYNGVYSVSGITAYAKGITRTVEETTTFYYGQGDDVSLTLTSSAPVGYACVYTPTSGSISGSDNPYTLHMPNRDVTISRSLRSTGKAVDVSYILADGTPQTAQAIALDGTETSHGQSNQETWYYVGIDISHAQPLTLYGNVHLILADGCNMSVTTTDDYCIYADGHSLHIYGQTDGTGVLNARTQGRYSVIGIFNGILGIHGGNVTATVDGTSNAIYVEETTDGYALIIDRGTLTATVSSGANSGAGICISGGNACINGGQVEATGGNSGIAVMDYSTAIPGTLTLGGGTLKVSRFNTYSGYSYAGTLAVADGYTYTDGTTLYNSATPSATLAALTNVTLQPCLVLADNASNTSALTANSGKTIAVQLAGRTFYKDGDWNTLCLPFSIDDINAKDASDNYICPLHGATVKTLVSSIFSGGTLSMNFTEDKDNLTAIQAGVPYIVKWTPVEGYVNDDEHNIVSPVFTGVTVSNTTANVETAYVDFIGTYSPVSIAGEDRSILFLGEASTLYYPSAAMTIKACRAYFQLNGLTAGDDPNAVRAFNLNFGDGSGSADVSSAIIADGDVRAPRGWYTLDGRKLDGKPTHKGLYINNGVKVVIK